jgi:putative ABC transport system ATP-binding protein
VRCVSHEAVAFRGVSRSYGAGGASVEAVHGATGSFARGTIGALVGPSGSGKSTLLRILGGIDAADGGDVRVDGVDVAALEGRRRRHYRRNVVAFVSQRAAASLVPHLPVREQLGRGGRELAGRLGLDSRLDALSHELSGGEQARAALAVALSRATPVVLLDEPTAELDGASAALVTDALRHSAHTGRTVVVATHDPGLVALADARVELTAPQLPLADDERTPRALGPEAIRIEGVTKRYRDTVAVDEATLAVRRGELAILLGRSGSGKSTLLMVAGGWTTADTGLLHTPGTGWQETSYVAQRFGLLPELTIAENVGLPFRVAGTEDGGRVADILERLGLEALGGRLPARTSVGQQQRAAIARALVGKPAALLADEPTSHQDARSAAQVWAALAHACAGGTACLVATNDPEAARHADTIFPIDNGRIRRAEVPSARALPASRRPPPRAQP